MTVYTNPDKLKKDLEKSLNKIAKYFDGKHMVKLGIIGGDVERGDEATNSEIGFIHEFGSISNNLPMRSWLRMPIASKGDKLIKAVKEQRANIEKSVVKGETPYKLYEFLGIAGESIIQEAFDSSGFGTWEPNSKNTTTLVDTAQLRKSVTSVVEDIE